MTTFLPIFPQPLEKQPIIMLDPAEIRVDAATYQYRSGGDANGVTQKRRVESDHWDPKLSQSPLLVHRCIEKAADGTPKDVYYLVDGHHRRDKAVALNAKGIGPGKLPAIVLGPEFTKEDAKVAGIYKNMLHGRHDAVDFVDAARGFGGTFDVNKLKMKLEGDVKIAYNMRSLSDLSHNLIASGLVPMQAAAEVTARLHNPAQQDAALFSISARLHQDYANYPIPEPQGWAATVGRKPAPTPAANANLLPGFLSRLQQERGTAQPTTGMGFA